jgi:hypothetical protein
VPGKNFLNLGGLFLFLFFMFKFLGASGAVCFFLSGEFRGLNIFPSLADWILASIVFIMVPVDDIHPSKLDKIIQIIFFSLW